MQNITEEQVKGVNSLYSTELDNDDDNTTMTTITQNDHLENEESEESEEEEEDEEEARRALTLMLEEFGDGMFIDKEDN